MKPITTTHDLLEAAAQLLEAHKYHTTAALIRRNARCGIPNVPLYREETIMPHDDFGTALSGPPNAVPQGPTLSGIQDTSDTVATAGSALPKGSNELNAAPSQTSDTPTRITIAVKELNRIAWHLGEMVKQYGHPDWSANEMLEGLTDLTNQIRVIANGIENAAPQVASSQLSGTDAKLSEPPVAAPSHTPRTDANTFELQDGVYSGDGPMRGLPYILRVVNAEEMKKLERELANALQINEQLCEQVNSERTMREKAEAENAALREKLTKLAESKRPLSDEFAQKVIDGQVKEIDRLTKLVQAEREQNAALREATIEECAKLCERIAAAWTNYEGPAAQPTGCAEAIRALKGKE